MGPQHTYLAKGPMGKGLGISSSGKHIAHVAGTGILPFIDLVAHLILCVLQGDENVNFKMERAIDINSFSFILHTSFTNEKEAICLELIDTLKRLCKKHKRENLFKHVSRITRPTNLGTDIAPDKSYHGVDYFKKVFNENQDAKKIWVCGPPRMQEDFDRAAESNKLKMVSLPAGVIEVL